MKKIFLTILVLVVTLSLTGPAMAKGAKVPKNLCLNSTNPAFNISLSISKGGKIVVGDTKIPSYNIQGILFHSGSSIPVPVAGAGYLNDTLFQFTFSGTFPTASGPISVEGTLMWDVNQVLAEGALIYNSSTGIVTGGMGVLSVVACDGP